MCYDRKDNCKFQSHPGKKHIQIWSLVESSATNFPTSLNWNDQNRFFLKSLWHGVERLDTVFFSPEKLTWLTGKTTMNEDGDLFFFETWWISS